MNHEIPPITHPLGRHWDQPAREAILVDGTHALMSVATFKALAEYSATVPTGCYEGKMWRRHDGIYFGPGNRFVDPESRKWLLCWFGPSSKPDHCSINYREILIVS
jgi:hypothetical protein